MTPAALAPPRRYPRAQVYFDPVPMTAAFLGALPRGSQSGPVCRDFERHMARTLGAAHAVALPHARVALDALLGALALPPGSEVLMTPVTIPDIVNVVLMHGLRPVFVDLGHRTCNIDCDALERSVTPRSRLILLTHLAGIPSAMDRITALAARHGLEVLEDCSQAMGTTFHGRPLGTFGRAGFFSMTPLKPLSTFTGGLVITDDPALDAELRRYGQRLPPPGRGALLALLAREHVLWAASEPALFRLAGHRAVAALEAARPSWVAELQRGNLAVWRPRRLAPLRRAHLPAPMLVQYADAQAAVGLRGVRALASDNRERRDLALSLLALLGERGLTGGPRPLCPDECTFWRFPYFASDVGALRDRLRRHGVDSSATNLPCMSREPEYPELAADTPEARRFTDEMVFLPLHPGMGPDDMRRLADVVARCAEAGP